MPNNNPNGVNSFNQFAPEQPYGQATQNARLAGGAPLAGGPIAAGPLNAPRRGQKQAVRGKTQQAAPEQPTIAPPSMQASPSAMLAAQWAAIAAIPGASPQVVAMAQLAQQQASG